MTEAIHSFLEQKTHLEDSNFKPFSSNVKQNILNSCIIQDNGYSSNQSGKLENQNVSNLNSNLSLDTATEHTVDAHLAPKQRG